MLVNQASLRTLFIGFNTAFKSGLDSQAATQYGRIATTIPSTSKENDYGWLGKVPNVREWIGDRVVNSISQSGYTVKNKSYELTIGVAKEDIEDDNLGIYTPLFTELGSASGSHYDQLVFALLKAGFASFCYDKQFFFDTDHPVLDEAGAVTSVANTDGGSGTPWFLIDDSRYLKPIILQKRKAWNLVRKDDEKDDNVFDGKEFVYGTDARHNVGFGFWQFAWGSKQALDAAHYETARAALMGMKGDFGRPLGVKPRLLVVPPTLEGAANRLMTNDRLANGATNEWKGTAEVMVCPWLA
ncbi:Mu-like prophage major head subunit gpT family protein [soil metagenome]